jgi:hypothetical protein
MINCNYVIHENTTIVPFRRLANEEQKIVLASTQGTTSWKRSVDTMSSNIEVELRPQLAAKDVIIGDLTTQLTTKDAQLRQRSRHRSWKPIWSSLQPHLIRPTRRNLSEHVEVRKMVDDLDLSGCVNRVREVLSDLKVRKVYHRLLRSKLFYVFDVRAGCQAWDRRP